MGHQETQALAVIPAQVESNLPITQAAVDMLVNQRKLFHAFVKEQMTKEVDYGVIPGTNKDSLFKPGAEKLKQLFGLGTKVILVDRILERETNFALLNYRAQVYSLRNPDVIIGECEGSCNSQEKKYRERNIYKWNDVTKRKELVGTEATPVCDILNTLQKMAQKRAVVGAIILATGASDFFTHDIDDADDAETTGTGDPTKPAPTVIKAALPKATSATSRDQSQGAQPAATAKPIVTPQRQAPAGQGSFADFKGSAVTSAPQPTLEQVGQEIVRVAFGMGMTGEQIGDRAREMFNKSTGEMTLQECLDMLNTFRNEAEARMRGK